MTKEKLKSIFKAYETLLKRNKTLVPRQLTKLLTKVDSDELTFRTKDEHLLFMCQEAPKLVDEGEVEKAMRWLGFLQGVFWSDTEFTLDELKNHSRPDKE
jgi:hypothetical protein